MTEDGSAIKAYLAKLSKAIENGLDDILQLHKQAVPQAALTVPLDLFGVAVMDGESVVLCKYVVCNA